MVKSFNTVSAKEFVEAFFHLPDGIYNLDPPLLLWLDEAPHGTFAFFEGSPVTTLDVPPNAERAIFATRVRKYGNNWEVLKAEKAEATPPPYVDGSEVLKHHTTRFLLFSWWSRNIDPSDTKQLAAFFQLAPEDIEDAGGDIYEATRRRYGYMPYYAMEGCKVFKDTVYKHTHQSKVKRQWTTRGVWYARYPAVMAIDCPAVITNASVMPSITLSHLADRIPTSLISKGQLLALCAIYDVRRRRGEPVFSLADLVQAFVRIHGRKKLPLFVSYNRAVFEREEDAKVFAEFVKEYGFTPSIVPNTVLQFMALTKSKQPAARFYVTCWGRPIATYFAVMPIRTSGWASFQTQRRGSWWGYYHLLWGESERITAAHIHPPLWAQCGLVDAVAQAASRYRAPTAEEVEKKLMAWARRPLKHPELFSWWCVNRDCNVPTFTAENTFAAPPFWQLLDESTEKKKRLVEAQVNYFVERLVKLFQAHYPRIKVVTGEWEQTEIDAEDLMRGLDELDAVFA